MHETVITVRGEYSDRFPAERATVQVEANFDGNDRQDVASLAVTTSNAVRDTITSLHTPIGDGEGASGRGPVTEWSADLVNVWSERPWSADGARLPLVFHARIGLTAQFSDFSALALWIQTILGIDGVNVGGIDWTLTPGRSLAVTADVRKRAVNDAVSKAAAYADSLGLGSVRAVAIADPGMLGESVGTPGGDVGFRANAAMMKSAPSELAFNPRAIEVRAAVDARFLAS